MQCPFLMGKSWILALAFLLCAYQPAWAQGIGSILNPEGSRLFPQPITYPRHPGKPDLRWRDFKWRYTELNTSTPFRLYFYDEEKWTARFAIPIINREVEELRQTFNYSPSRSFAYILFAGRREFQQANVFNISEGVQGVTATTEPTMAVPYWGNRQEFEHISKHEMVHQFQVQKVGAAPGMPLWFIEGMAEYYSLGGLDYETLMYVRDLVKHPDEKRGYKMPKFFEEGSLNFIHVYKVGQLKIAFLETTFGKDTVQRILTVSSYWQRRPRMTFEMLVREETKKSSEEIEQLWGEYVAARAATGAHEQQLTSFERLDWATDRIDHFRVSPDEKFLATREIDPLTGQASIQLVELGEKRRKRKIAEEGSSRVLSLFFMQVPNLALSNEKLVYVAETVAGPILVWRNLQKGEEKKRALYEQNIIGASSPAISPDQNQVAFVGNTADGRSQVYVLDLKKDEPARQLTQEHYAWRDLHWADSGLFASSDRTANGKFGIVRIDSTGAQSLTAPEQNQNSVSLSGGDLLYQSYESGSAQVHLRSAQKTVRLTGIETALAEPQLRDSGLYALGFHGGRYWLYRIAKTAFLNEPAPHTVPTQAPWALDLAELAQVTDYNGFKTAGARIDNIAAFFGSGIKGIGATGSDLMRNYTLSAEYSVFGTPEENDYHNGSAFFASQRGRSTWIAGAYYTTQPRLESLFESDTGINTYLHREFGALGALQYPLGAFTFVDFELRVGGVTRGDYTNAALRQQFEAANPGLELITAPMVRLGFDKIVYEAYAGPIDGFGALLESDTSLFPVRRSTSERVRLDLSQYWQLVGRTVFLLQGMAGASFGGNFRNPFFISSDDILRGYPFGDDRLQGNYFGAAKAEIRFPIGTFFGFPPLRGMLSYDHGTVFRRWGRAEEGRASSYSGGLSLNLPPIAISFLLSDPIRAAPGDKIDGPVAHFLFRYLYL